MAPDTRDVQTNCARRPARDGDAEAARAVTAGAPVAEGPGVAVSATAEPTVPMTGAMTVTSAQLTAAIDQYADAVTQRFAASIIAGLAARKEPPRRPRAVH